MDAQDFFSYLKVIRNWWWVIVLIFAATVGTMVTITSLTEPVYRAMTTIQVSAPPPQEVPLFSDFGRLSLRDAIAQTQISFAEFLQEGDAAWRVLDELPNIPMTPREVRETIEIETPTGSQLMRISVTAAEPEVAALLANAIVRKGLEEYGALLAQPTASTRIFVEQELEVAIAELKSAEEGLTQFRINNTVGDLDDSIRNQNALLRSLKVDADRARSEGDITKAQSLERIFFEREAELQDLIGLSVTYNELNDKVARARETHNFLRDRLITSQIKESQILQLGSIQVITEARPPRTPVAAISSRLIVLGAFASLAVGVLLALFLEYLEISGVFGRARQDTRQGEMAVLTDRIG